MSDSNLTPRPTLKPTLKPTQSPGLGAFIFGRVVPAIFMLHGAALLGAIFAGAQQSSAAWGVIGLSFPVLPGAIAGIVGLSINPMEDPYEWVFPAIMAGAMTWALLTLVDRARTWERRRGIPVLWLLAAVSAAQGFYLTMAMRA